MNFEYFPNVCILFIAVTVDQSVFQLIYVPQDYFRVNKKPWWLFIKTYVFQGSI